jgi:tetratricopeptide (TPR) repeat protein
MKADHRKELHTNALADHLGKFVTKAKSGSGMIWGGLLLIIALGVAWWWWTGSSANRATDAWTTWWYNRDTAADLENPSVANRLKGTSADKAAKLALADHHYEDGYNDLFRKDPKRAQKKFEDAFKVYEELSKASADPELGVRALLGAAKCQESLGEVDRAVYYYDETVAKFDKTLRTASGQQHPLVAEAEKRAAELRDGAAIAFYGGKNGKGWPDRLPTIGQEPPKPTPDAPTGTPAGK